MSEAEIRTGAGYRVLIVEDNSVNLELVFDILESEGYTVSAVTDGREALIHVRQFRPHVILMDIQLPGMDGLAVTRLLKADPETRGIPVIALTAHAMRGDEETIAKAGCDEYIAKPVHIRQLRAAVARHASQVR